MNIPTPALTDRSCEGRTKASWVKTAGLAVAVFTATAVSALAQNLETTEIQPAPAAIGADVPATYFGPQPSQVQRELVGEYQNLKSGKINFDKGTITLPLYQGAMKSGEIVWYIVTDTDDKGNADQLGLNYSPKLTFADVGRAVRKATLDSKLEPQVVQRRVIVGPSPEWPVIFSIAVTDWSVVDAGDTTTHQAALIKLPQLVAIGTEPVAAVVMPF